MKTKIGMMFCCFGLAVGSGLLVLRAADSAPSRTTGHVLILENGRTLEGDIEREGNQYRVRRAIGETWVSGDKVLRLCASLEEAYEYFRNQANLQDPDERTRLARWCQQHDLSEQALAETLAAVELRPHNREYRRLLESLQRTAAEKNEEKGAKSDDRQANGHEFRSTIGDPRNSLPPADLTADSVNQFITRVQPVLMNACAACHGPAHHGPFQLERVMDNGVVSRRATQHNLAHVLAQINPENFAVSPLLTKAVSLHGEAAQPPIKNREAPAFHRLADWVKQTLENNPQLHERSGSPAASVESSKASSLPAEPPSASGDLKPASTDFAATQPPPPQPTTPVDPFDPILFNRQAHPEKQ
jgi:hypothetical protein